MEKGFSTDWLEKLKQNNDIVTVANKYITLTKRGKTCVNTPMKTYTSIESKNNTPHTASLIILALLLLNIIFSLNCLS